jgi:hypothetical protein
MTKLNDHLVSAIVIPQEYWQKIDKSEVICKDFAVSFFRFCAKNKIEIEGEYFIYHKEKLTQEELLNKFQNEQ